MFCSASDCRGFSLIEFVITITIIAILLVITVPKLMDNTESRLAMAAKMVRSDIACVQRLAIHAGIPYEITFSDDGYTVADAVSEEEISYGGRFPVVDMGADFGVEISTEGNLTFNSLGEPVTGSLDSVTVASDSGPALTKNILIERDTGHARVE